MGEQTATGPGDISNTVSLRAAFTAALPTQWRAGIDARTVVALFRVDAWSGWGGAATAQLHDSERLRVDRHRLMEQRRVLALAYALHRLFLAECLGCEPAAVSLRRDDRGCPRVDIPAIRTSLSHADGAFAMAVTRGGPVGVDIEAAARDTAMDEIAERIWHPQEAAGLALQDGPERRKALLALWVRKEAVLKAMGVGLALEMNTLVAPVDGLALLPQHAEPIWSLQLDAGSEWVAAVASTPGMPVEYRWLHPPE